MKTMAATERLGIPSAQAPLRLQALRAVLSTDEGLAPAVARLGLGLVMLPHGLQKLAGWFGGYGFAASMGYLTETIGLAPALALLVIVIESLGSLALIVGAGARPAALGMIAVMAGAVFTVHHQHGFFMNWAGGSGGEGFEYHILVAALAMVVLVAGAGRWSVDGAIRRLTAGVHS